MSWTVKVKLEEEECFCLVTATCNAGQECEFVFVDRVEVCSLDGNRFVSDALAALVARDDDNGDDIPFVDWLTTKLNS